MQPVPDFSMIVQTVLLPDLSVSFPDGVPCELTLTEIFSDCFLP